MDAVRDTISILVSLVIPLMDIQFRVSSLDRSLIVKDRCTPCFEELDNGSMRRKFRREIENLEDRLLYRGCIEIDNLSVQAIESFPVFPSPRNVPRARSKIIDKRNNETTLAKARCNVRDQRMGSKPQLFSFYPDAFNSFVNLSPVPLSQRVVTLIPTP